MGTVAFVELKNIYQNPFQVRDGEDTEHIKNLAMSITEQGLLQIPSARMHPAQQGKDAAKYPIVELVFGHSRLAAFKFLTDTGNPGYERMPVNIVEMTDEQMFMAAVAENRERKDLTPIEEAKAMLVYRDQFKKNSEEIGQLFHLSDSAVRNKMRLLDLPDEVREKVGKTITEGAAREVLVFLSLPENARESEKWWSGSRVSSSKILEKMLEEGVSTESMKEWVDDVVGSSGERMDSKPWKNTDELVGEGIIGVCKGCANLITRDGADWCLLWTCFKAKKQAYELQYLSQASLLSGIPILEEGKEAYSDHTDFNYGNESVLESIREHKCENLRLMYDHYSRGGREAEKITHLVDEGFEHAKIVCCKRNGQCTCMKAKAAGVEVGGGSEEDLKEARRQMQQQQRFEAELIKGMRSEAAMKLFKGLSTLSFEVWKTVLEKITYSAEFKKASSLETLLLSLSEVVIEKSVWGSKADVLRQLNELLVKCGMEELDISFGKEEEGPDRLDGEFVGGFVESPVQGKTLIEVFEDEERS